MSQTVQLDGDGGVATITLNRPDKLNAISPELWDDLDGALEEVRPGTSVRVVRIKGAGRSFCSGYDMTSGSSVYSMAPTVRTVTVLVVTLRLRSWVSRRWFATESD